MKIKKGALLTGFVLFVMGFMIWVFSNKEITDKCSDMMINCFQEAAIKEGWNIFRGGFGCMINNLMCVFSRIPEGF